MFMLIELYYPYELLYRSETIAKGCGGLLVRVCAQREGDTA